MDDIYTRHGCDWSLVAQGWQVVRDIDEVVHCQGAFSQALPKCPAG
jgi:hypothetical protein